MTIKLSLEVALDNAFCIMSEHANLEEGYQAAFKYLYNCPCRLEYEANPSGS